LERLPKALAGIVSHRSIREHVIALEARGKGLLGITLRYPYEVRKEDEYFEDIPDEKIPKDMLELASHIVETKSGHFEPEKFEDQYEDALKELLKKKQAGEKIEAPRERAPAKVVNLIDALRRSVEAERGRSAKRQAPSAKARSSDPSLQRRKKLVSSKAHLGSAAVLAAPSLVARPTDMCQPPAQQWRF
jgi:DNA end-binding protein Ku